MRPARRGGLFAHSAPPALTRCVVVSGMAELRGQRCVDDASLCQRKSTDSGLISRQAGSVMAAHMAALLAAAALVLALSVEPAHAYAPAKLSAHMLRPNGASATPRSCSVSLPVCANWLAPASGSRRCKPVAQRMAAGATWEGKPVPLPDQDEVLAGPTVLRRVWVTDAPGNLRSLKQETELLPPPGPGEVRVRIESIGLNFADVFTVLGMYDAAPKGQRVVPGLEFSGVVEEVGRAPRQKLSTIARSADGKRNIVVNGVDTADSDARTYPFRPGDRVMGVTRFGAFASHINIGTAFIRTIPEHWSFQQGAAFVVQACTAWYGMIDLGKGEPGKTVLVHSAAGGVGGFALQICRMLGMTPVAVVGSKAKQAYVAEQYDLPLSQIIVRPRRRSKWVRALDGALANLRLGSAEIEGFDIVMDSLAGKYFQGAYDALARGGRHVMFGAAVFTPWGDSGKVWWSPFFWLHIVPTFLRRPKLDVQQMIGENKAVMGFNLIWMTDGKSDPTKLGKLVDDMMAPSVRWTAPVVGKEFAFADIPAALRFFKSGKSTGKVVVNVDH